MPFATDRTGRIRSSSLTYDEHGGFYDHAVPPPAPQNHALNSGRNQPRPVRGPVQSAPASEKPGGGAECSSNLLEHARTPASKDAIQLCPALAANPTGRVPGELPHLQSTGCSYPICRQSLRSRSPTTFRTPVGDHTSMLGPDREALPLNSRDARARLPAHLTLRDQYANTIGRYVRFRPLAVAEHAR